MSFHRAGYNLILLLAASLVVLAGDLALFATGQPTISELVWSINQVSLAAAFAVGVLAGHLFTVPK